MHQYALIRARKVVRGLGLSLTKDERKAVAKAAVDELRRNGDKWRLDEEMPDQGTSKRPDGGCTVSFFGGQRYAGFSFTCGLPPRTFLADLNPDALHGISWRAKELHAAIRDDHARREAKELGLMYQSRGGR